MAITTYDAYLAQMRQGILVPWWKEGATAGSHDFASMWLADNDPGAAPAGGAAVSNATRGALHFGGASTSRILGVDLAWSNDYGPHCLTLCDRLVHTDGLVGNSGALQATNLPTPALTRYTTGLGVFAGLEIYTNISNTTPQDCVVTYTNQAGTGGRTGTCEMGSSRHFAAREIVPVALQAGDTGVRSVESVQLAGATGAAVGSFGVTLYRPLMIIPFIDTTPLNSGTRVKLTYSAFLNMGMVPSVAQGCCLWFIQRFFASALLETQGQLHMGVEP
ncbi:hypothetical protein Rctr197k_081 [Virus Rctr197k]|nr:hypothetical protein Rctr197k_081 [Virus Rctr197k]